MSAVASPVARRAAVRLGVDLATLTGSGPRGRIVKADVARAAMAPAPRAIAAPVLASTVEPAVISVAVDVDVTAALELCAQIAGAELIDLIVRAVALAVGDHPPFDADIRLSTGVRFAAPGQCSLGAIARQRVAPPSDDAAAFTIVDLGPDGADAATPRLGRNQSPVLCIGAVRERPAARGGELVLAQIATLTLVGGAHVAEAEASRFLADVRDLLQAPLAVAFA